MNPHDAADFLAGLVRTPDTRTNVERRALNVLIDHARATAPEGGDLAEVAKLLDSHAAISDRPGQLDQLEALAARVRAHRCPPAERAS